MYEGVITDDKHGFLNKGKSKNSMTASVNYWYIGGGQEDQIEILDSEHQIRDLFLFREFRGLFSRCGFLFSSDDIAPQTIGFVGDGNIKDYLDFRRVSKNWFYGCANYSGD